MTRTHTPPRRNADGSETYKVQRACNGCGRDIGDATANELDAAVDGASLPDVRDECGCSNPVVQSIAKAMCDVDHDWDFPCRGCMAAAVPLVNEARRQMLVDVAVLFARQRDVWIDTRVSHPEDWDYDAEHAYTEGARVLAAWAEDPTRMDGPLRAARSGATHIDPGVGAADTGLPASDPSHDRGTNSGRGGEPSSSVPAPDLDAVERAARGMFDAERSPSDPTGDPFGVTTRDRAISSTEGAWLLEVTPEVVLALVAELREARAAEARVLALPVGIAMTSVPLLQSGLVFRNGDYLYRDDVLAALDGAES